MNCLLDSGQCIIILHIEVTILLEMMILLQPKLYFPQ